MDKLTRPHSQPPRARSISKPLGGLSISPATPTAGATPSHASGTHHSDTREKSQPLLHKAVGNVGHLGVNGGGLVNGGGGGLGGHRSVSAAPGGPERSTTPMDRSVSGTAIPAGSAMPSPLLPGQQTPVLGGNGGGASGVAGAEAGYIDAIGLRLSEQVNRACLGVDFKAKKGFKRGVGWTLGEGVVR